MAEILRSDYTGRTFEGFQAKLEAYLWAEFPDASNDLYQDHILKVLTQLMSFTGDQLAFYLDMVFNEILWDKVGHRRNIVALAKLLGYEPRGISSAQVVLDATTPSFVGTLSLAKGTKVPTSVSGVVFELLENVIITAPTVSFQVNAIEGTTRTDTRFSNGNTSQRFTSIYPQVSSSVDPTITVDGVEWTKVPYLWDVLTGNYYELLYLDEQKFQVVFGDGVHGNVPPDTVPIELIYLTSKGVEGNIIEGKISTTITGLVGASPHDVTVVNNEKASGGAPEETVEEIRKNAPIAFQSLGVVTTGRDLQGFIEAEAGVAKAQVTVDGSTKIVKGYVVASGYLPPSQALLDSLYADIQETLVMGAILGLYPATFPTVDVAARIYLLSNYSVEEAQDFMNAALDEYFTPEDPAQSSKTVKTPLYRSDFVRLLDSVEGVDHIELDMLTRTPLPDYLVWVSDSGTLGSLVVGEASKEETWTVSMTSATTFEIQGSVSGLQVNTGTLDTPYSTDGLELSFTLQSGVNPNIGGDYAEVKTSQLVASVPVSDGEFVLKGSMSFVYTYVS